ncbi:MULTISPECIES: T9SS type A sorting domain-containing protein [Aequorivita]|uniref:T9SS type A sorting domain-containing protein n=1 Tax=Aequorivita iocasae TaxID=2803865 RepID=A0ABX7DU49_9FLAO|nr:MULTISPECIES: T9SS type A sorting domain-containing protein [Aequorivita]QQX76674.1 T9SS type A sorting domain-containing protein [Aequorivita iocasae]UCA56147.1 T9SS type A sorting domain-containing protein [Aequorivita sp. F7]
MKKITMLILLMICAIGYSQTDAKSAAAKASVTPLKQQKENKAVQQMKNEFKYEGSSATDTGYRASNYVPLFVAPEHNDNSNDQEIALPGRNAAVLIQQTQPIFRAYEALTVAEEAEIFAAEQEALTTNVEYNPEIQYVNSLAAIIPTAGATETFAVVTGDFFYDPTDGVNGGPGGNCTTTSSGDPGDYPNCGCTTTTTLTGTGLSVEFLSFNIFGNFDVLNIYDGPDTSSPQIYDSNLNASTDTLAGMIAANGSAIFNSTSGALTFEFTATTVVNTCGWEVEVLSAGGGGGGVCGNPMLEINQDVQDTCMANISQTGLAQSYIPLESEAAGAGIKFTAVSSGLDVELSLWDGLPNAGGTMLASGITQTDGTEWADVFWDPVVSVTVGTTYYIVIDGDITLPCIAGSTNNPYPDGNVYANAGYNPFPTFDYTFRTYSCDGGGGGTACSESNPSNNFENGFTSSNNTPQVIAADITVPADTDFNLDALQANWLVFDGEVIISADITIYNDLGGLPDPSSVVATLTGVVPTSQAVIGDFPANSALDALELNFDISPVMLNGQSGSPTTYWISIYVDNTSANGSFWENSTASTVGNDGAFSPDAGVTWAIALPGSDQVYEFSGICEPIGGGPTCTSTAYDSTAVPFDIDGSGNQTADCANAPNLIPVTVSDAGTIGTDAILENITIDIAHTFTADLDLYLVSPNGTELLLANDLGGGIDDGYNGTMFEDGGADITLATAPFGVGPYEPMGGTFAAAFAGEDITGDWNLKVCDDAGGDTGQVLQFSMSICVPPVITNDDCSNAYDLSCGDSVVGETLTATDSGGNAAPDVFYKFTGDGSAQLVTISLCAATDYDSVLRVFDDCDLANELAFNDDSCGLQSELTFTSDGTSTYYIMVEGFGSNSGNFSLDVTCAEPLPNDDCSGAIALSCGDSVAGTTDGATVDNGVAPDCGTAVTSPGVWYSLDDNSGLPGTITLSLCNGTDYDSKISVYTGDCGAPPLTCVDGNDDSCGLQSEITFNSDGNTSYLILVHGFGGATGNFTLDVTCTPTPPPNDMIVNSIDVDEVGFPYTDPSVAMPAATTENGNPAGCDLTGANGVWYNFVSAGDGTANATIVTPGGASSVTFYTAPNENASETDLTLVGQQSNQCGPGTSASIFTLAGQAYYVFVLNSGAVTDIVIDGTNLGVSDNAISGFSYYPNPAQGVLNLKSVDNIEQVSLYNLLGQRVMDSQVGAAEASLDVSGLSTGTYLMKVTVNGQVGTYKVLKQ